MLSREFFSRHFFRHLIIAQFQSHRNRLRLLRGQFMENRAQGNGERVYHAFLGVDPLA